MKAKIYFLLLAMPLLSVPDLQGKSVKTYKEPQCLYSECPQAAVTHVEFADTATVVSFRLSGHPYEQFVLPERIYACGDDGGRYGVRRMEGTDDGRRLWLSGDGTAEFRLVFESLPADTKCLDIVNIGNNAVFRFFGIHDRRHAPKIREREEAVDRGEVAEDVRRRGTAVIRGRIADYSPEWRLDFIKCYHRPLFSVADLTGESYPVMARIDGGGEFEMTLDTDFPVFSYLTAGLGGSFADIQFYVRPGDTLDVDIRGMRNGLPETEYRSSSAAGCFTDLLQHGIQPAWYSHGPNFHRSTEVIAGDMDAFLDRTMRLCDYISAKYGMSPWETHVLKTGQRLAVLDAFLYAMNTADHYREEAIRNGMPQDKAGDAGDADFGILAEMPLDDPTALLFGGMFESAARQLMSSRLFRGGSVPEGVQRLDRLAGRSGGTPLMVETALAGSAEPGGSPLTGSYAVPQGAGGDILRSIIGEGGKYTELVCISSPEAGRRLLGDRMTNLLTDFRDSGDIQFVFVFDGGSFTQEEYESFIRNGLDGGACHRVSREDFTDMREALHFTGGTAVRTLDRDGQVMRTPLSLDNETYFRSSLRRLLQAKQP